MPSRDFFVYTAEFLPLNAGATAPVNVPIQADSSFELAELAGDVKTADTDEVAIADPAILISIVDQGTGRLLMDRPELWANIVGTAQRPFLLPMPKTFAANATIQITATSLLGAGARRVRLSLIGYKIFP